MTQENLPVLKAANGGAGSEIRLQTVTGTMRRASCLVMPLPGGDSKQVAAVARDHQYFYLNHTAKPGFPAAPKRQPGSKPHHRFGQIFCADRHSGGRQDYVLFTRKDNRSSAIVGVTSMIS